jgi:hypothetical protein
MAGEQPAQIARDRVDVLDRRRVDQRHPGGEVAHGEGREGQRSIGHDRMHVVLVRAERVVLAAVLDVQQLGLVEEPRPEVQSRLPRGLRFHICGVGRMVPGQQEPEAQVQIADDEVVEGLGGRRHGGRF